MSLSVLIYSPDSIRGKIILKTIRLENIAAVLCSSYPEIETALKEKLPDVFIFDAKDNFWGELDYLKKLPEKLPRTTRIILAEPEKITFLKKTALRNDLFTPEPFHPEYILSLVKAVFASRLKKKAFSKAA